MTVGELNAVLQNEGVDRIALSVLSVVEVLGNDGLVLTESNLYLTVLIRGGKHTDLGHTHDGAVRSGGGEVGVEQTVKVVGHDNECIGFLGLIAATARAAGKRTDQKHESKRKTNNSCFHLSILLYINYKPNRDILSFPDDSEAR